MFRVLPLLCRVAGSQAVADGRKDTWAEPFLAPRAACLTGADRAGSPGLIAMSSGGEPRVGGGLPRLNGRLCLVVAARDEIGEGL